MDGSLSFLPSDTASTLLDTISSFLADNVIVFAVIALALALSVCMGIFYEATAKVGK